jgi:uncharacterized protein
LGEKTHPVKRVVLDTNIFISALLFEGEAFHLVSFWKQGEIIPLITAEILKEIIRVLAYPRFHLTETEINALVHEEILPYAETVGMTRQIDGVCEDADDDIFLACAVNGQADAIISGDIHLLRIKEFKGVPIFKLADFKALEL